MDAIALAVMEAGVNVIQNREVVVRVQSDTVRFRGLRAQLGWQQAEKSLAFGIHQLVLIDDRRVHGDANARVLVATDGLGKLIREPRPG